MDKVFEKVNDLLGIADDLIHYTSKEIQMFNDFKVERNKNYDSLFVERTSCLNFVSNMRKVQQHNLQYELGKNLFKMDTWEYSDMSSEDINQFMNNFMITNLNEKANFASDFSNVSAPASLNYTRSGAVTSVRNQVKTRQKI